MYDYLTGKITVINPTHVTIENNGIGYLIFTSNPYEFDLGEAKIYVVQIVRETELSLYGFMTIEARSMFEKLISVTGIGPKSALAILANNDLDGLVNAINSEDSKYLTKFPGIGKKTAQQIILDLKGKLSETDETAAKPNSKNSSLDDALLALESLGYSKRDIHRIKDKLVNDPGASTEEYIRLALTLL